MIQYTLSHPVKNVLIFGFGKSALYHTSSWMLNHVDYLIRLGNTADPLSPVHTILCLPHSIISHVHSFISSNHCLAGLSRDLLPSSLPYNTVFVKAPFALNTRPTHLTFVLLTISSSMSCFLRCSATHVYRRHVELYNGVMHIQQSPVVKCQDVLLQILVDWFIIRRAHKQIEITR